VGFSAGQVQYLDLIKKDTSKLFNEEVTKHASPPLLTYLPTPACTKLPGNRIGLKGAGGGRGDK
jgi:hypothetical protein